MARVVVIEGPDGAGKTTLAERLSAETGFAIWHEGPPPPDQPAYDYYLGRLFDAYMSMDVPGVIFDRFARGELVYGPVLRGKSGLSDVDFERLLHEFRFANVVEVLALPPIWACLDSWRRRRGREFILDEGAFLETYRRWAAFAPSFDFVWDYTATLAVPTSFERILEAARV